jgi:hypothetical protein
MSGLIIPSARRCSSVGRRSPAPCATTSLQTFEPVLSRDSELGLDLAFPIGASCASGSSVDRRFLQISDLLSQKSTEGEQTIVFSAVPSSCHRLRVAACKDNGTVSDVSFLPAVRLGSRPSAHLDLA